jgi:hypothetical protein
MRVSPTFAVRGRAVAIINGLRYFAIVFNGRCRLVKPRRDMDVTYRSLGALCRDRDWSKRRLLHELQNGLTYRTIPPGHEINWHHPDVERGLDVEASEVTYTKGVLDVEGALAFDRPTVGVEVLPPTDALQASSAPPTPVKRQRKPVKPWSKPPPQKDIKGALVNIRETKPTLSGEKLAAALCERLGEGMTRQRARSAIKRYAPETVKPRGRPRKNNSPK